MHDISIKNFRCYSEKSIEFRRGINLLIGDNSVGKTSLLRACNLVNNTFFCGFSDENTIWKSAEDDDFREIKNDNIQTDDLPISIAFHLDDSDFPALDPADNNALNLEQKKGNNKRPVNTKLIIEKKSKKNARNLVTGLKPLKEYASFLQAKSHIIIDGVAYQIYILPLFAYFTTEDIHTKRKFSANDKHFKKYPQKASFGYFESFDCKGLLDSWIRRLLVLKEAKKGEEEINCVKNAIINALGSKGCDIISDLDIRPNDGQVYFIYTDGREVRSDLLSDGYRRLVSIIVDLAFRCALLNKIKFGENAYKFTHGTVIIDEIDEHLHPKLQVCVLKALHNTFPKIQFIVSTHAPLVMSSVPNVEENVVYILEFKEGEYTHKELKTYGLDASTIMELYMGEISRDINAKKDIENLFKQIDDEKYEDAYKMLNKLNKKYGGDSNPELIKAQAILSFFKN